MMDKKQISLRNRLFFQSTAASFQGGIAGQKIAGI